MEQYSDQPRQVDDEDGVSLLDAAIVLSENRMLLVLAPLLVGVLAFLATFAMKPVFTAKTVFLPPQQQSSAAAAAMQSLGALAGLAGGGMKNPTDQYVSFMQSATVANRLIDAYQLMQVYELESREEARGKLSKHVRIDANKKDGLISVEVDDHDPKRAAALANGYVDQLRRLTSEFTITEAQQRRALFERQLKQTQEKLVVAERTLQGSGINEGAIRAEPKAAAETYAHIKAQVTEAEIRLQSMRNYLTDEAVEFKLAQSNLFSLRAELRKAQTASTDGNDNDYIGKYREFKYQETLFELFAKQYELAKLDEARDGAAIQVVDVAAVPEIKSRPRRLSVAMTGASVTFIVALIGVFLREGWRTKLRSGRLDAKMARLRKAFR